MNDSGGLDRLEVVMGGIDVLGRRHQGSMGKGVSSTLAGAGARADREVAFHQLADLHLERCYRLATVVLGSETEARDAVHDAFVTAWRKYDCLRDPARFEAWFGRIVVNTCRDRMRHERHVRIHDLATALADTAQPDTTAPVADELVMRRALDRLKPEDRIVLALRFYRDMTVDEVAQAMAIRPRAASSRLHRALGRLRLILDQDREVAR